MHTCFHVFASLRGGYPCVFLCVCLCAKRNPKQPRGILSGLEELQCIHAFMCLHPSVLATRVCSCVYVCVASKANKINSWLKHPCLKNPIFTHKFNSFNSLSAVAE